MRWRRSSVGVGVNEGDVLVVHEEPFVRISFAGDDKRLP